MFETLEIDKDMQAVEGLWLIEAESAEVGGKLHFEEKFMLKNLFSGMYLSFNKTVKMVDNERVDTLIL